MISFLRKFLSDTSGATAIEYTILAAGIAVLLVAAASTIGTTLQGQFASANTDISG
jgi:pilus assembly protein Flp/PilA